MGKRFLFIFICSFMAMVCIAQSADKMALLNSAFNGRLQTNKNDINRLFVEHLGGTYQFQISKLHPILTISIPLDVAAY